MRASDYIITPRDIAELFIFGGRRVSLCDFTIALGLLFIAALSRGLLHLGAWDSLFIILLAGSLLWRLNPKYPIFAAITTLLLIPLLELLQQVNFLYVGDLWANAIAIWAYYFFVIGVANQVRELRGEKESPVAKKGKYKPVPKKLQPSEEQLAVLRKIRANQEALRRLVS